MRQSQCDVSSTPMPTAAPSTAAMNGFGHAHLLAANPAGGWAGAADPRAEIGDAAGY